MKTDLDKATDQFPALRSKDALLAARCALEWYDLTAEAAAEMFTEDCIYENRCFTLPVMDSFVIRDGKIASFREYWDVALLTQHLEGTETGDHATRTFEQYKGDTSEG